MDKAEQALDNLLTADWWDHPADEVAVSRDDTGGIVVWATTEIYFIGFGGSITRHNVSSREVVIL